MAKYARHAPHRVQAGRWFLAVQAVTDSTVTAFAVFTGDSKHTFYSKRSIASLRGKLLHLRDLHLAGERINIVTMWAPKDAAAQALTLDNLEKEFRERIEFHRKAVYNVCIIKDRGGEPMDTG